MLIEISLPCCAQSSLRREHLRSHLESTLNVRRKEKKREQERFYDSDPKKRTSQFSVRLRKWTKQRPEKEIDEFDSFMKTPNYWIHKWISWIDCNVMCKCSSCVEFSLRNALTIVKKCALRIMSRLNVLLAIILWPSHQDEIKVAHPYPLWFLIATQLCALYGDQREPLHPSRTTPPSTTPASTTPARTTPGVDWLKITRGRTNSLVIQSFQIFFIFQRRIS